MLPVKITHPLKDCGLLGAKRKFDIHTGVDLYCDEGAEVVSISCGTVIEVIPFTGEQCGTPWWNNTQAVVVQNNGLTYVYGEIKPCVKVGDTVTFGDKLGNVLQVLKKDKGVTPTSMLHLEVWHTSFYISNYTWKLENKKPLGIVDPLWILLLDTKPAIELFIIKSECGYIIQNDIGEYSRAFTMAADAKAFVADKNHLYLTVNSPLEDKLRYNFQTSKSLWFDN